MLNKVAEVKRKKIDANKNSGEDTDAAKNHFLENYSRKQKNFRADEPQVGDIVAGKMRGNRHDHQRSAEQAENGESAAATARDGKLGEAKFETADGKQGDISELRLDGLELHNAEKKQRVEQSGNGGDVLLGVGLDAAEDVRDAERQPIEEQHGDAGVIFGKVAAVRAIGTEEMVEPIKMIDVAGEDAENFQFEPAHFEDDSDQADGKN